MDKPFFFFNFEELGRARVGVGQSIGHKESVRLTKFCFFVGIPRFLTITTSQLEVGALMSLAFSHRLVPMGRSRLSRLNMLRMVNDKVELRCLLRMDGFHTRTTQNK